MAGIGDTLRSTREHRGLSIEQVAQDTRISARFLEALEAEQFDELPAPVYVRGFLRSYANYLKVDPQPLLDSLVGGERVPAGGPDGFVRGPQPPKQRPDPFQRTAPPPPPEYPPRSFEDEAEDEWSPEAPASSAVAAGSGYIPGSDLIEDPEYVGYAPEEPRFRPRTSGILLERPPGEGEGGPGTRAVAIIALAVLGVLAIVALGVFALGGDDGNGTVPAGGGDSGGETPGITPTNVIPVGSATPTASASASATASASPAASATGTVTATGTPATPTPTRTPGGPTATTTPTPTAAATATPAPTSTPTPLPTPTRAPILPENFMFGECTSLGPGQYDCGAPPYRVICYAPRGYPQNSNWWVDVNWSFGALPEGWMEIQVTAPSNGAIIKAGQTDCAG
ncbi:MAG: helix-turn-helix domain-containing protein [Dehalococcoidia bacterium]|nr:helix-turn-helix domain-containing protein [Dehalococcoidia bacterium]